MSYKFSIITINYNNSEGLEKTIKSVISQEYKDFEYIIIDGGSIDGSCNVIKTYSDRIDYWISEKDNGVYSALNKGIKQANGEYLIFMNSGDCFFDTSSLSIYASKVNSEASIYYGNSLGIYNDGSTYDIVQPYLLDIKFWLFSSLNHQSSLIKRELFSLYGFYETSLHIVSDWKWFFELHVKYRVKFEKIDDYLARYDMHGVSSEMEFVDKHQEEREYVIKEFFVNYWTVYLDLKNYQAIKPLDKREKHFNLIRRNPFLYSLLKAFMSFLLFFISDKKR